MKNLIHSLHASFKIKNELHELYITEIIRSFSISFISVFIPIYLLTIGVTLSTVLLFMAVQWTFQGFTSPLVCKVASKIGLKHSIVTSIPLYIIFLFFLVVYPNTSLYYLLPIAAIGGLSSSFYFVSLNSEFVKNVHRINEGVETSHLIAYPLIASIAAPLLSGYLLGFTEFNIVFSIAIALLVVSALPLFMSKDYKRFFKYKLSDFKILLRKKYALYFFSEGLYSLTANLIWPIFIFLTFKDFIYVGLVSAISGAGVSIFILVSGKLADKFNRKTIMRIGAITYSLTWFARYFITTQLEIFILSFLAGVTVTLISVPLFARFCEVGKKNNILAAASFREFWLSLGKVIPLILLVLLAVSNIEYMFIVSGLFALVFLFV